MIRAIAERLARGFVPDLPTSWVDKLSHGALVAQGAEQWTSTFAGHRVQRYAIDGKGKGPAVLLVHGLNGSAASMVPLVRGLANISPRIELFDMPGHGLSPNPTSGPISVLESAEVVLAALDQLHKETGRKVALVGNSLGGALVLYAASQRPTICAGVVGLNPAGAEVADLAVANLPRAFPDAAAGARRMAELLFKKTPLLFWLIGRDVARGWASDHVQRILSDVRAGTHRTLSSAVLRDLKVPLYVLWGAEDRLLPQASVDEFRSIPGARVELIPGCGHMPQIERPALTSERVAGFIAGLSA
jgi:pimeloyl-ACP methyl ester carboxylesterase